MEFSLRFSTLNSLKVGGYMGDIWGTIMGVIKGEFRQWLI